MYNGPFLKAQANVNGTTEEVTLTLVFKLFLCVCVCVCVCVCLPLPSNQRFYRLIAGY